MTLVGFSSPCSIVFAAPLIHAVRLPPLRCTMPLTVSECSASGASANTSGVVTAGADK